MEIKYRGAEAIVETRQWLGQEGIFKTRNKRGYRHPALEKRLVKERNQYVLRKEGKKK